MLKILSPMELLIAHNLPVLACRSTVTEPVEVRPLRNNKH